MKYKLYQFQFSTEEISDVGAGKLSPKLGCFLKCTNYPNSENVIAARDYYKLVGEIEASDLDGVRTLVGLGELEANAQSKLVVRLSPTMRYVNVGDVIIDESGIAKVVGEKDYIDVDIAFPSDETTDQTTETTDETTPESPGYRNFMILN